MLGKLNRAFCFLTSSIEKTTNVMAPTNKSREEFVAKSQHRFSDGQSQRFLLERNHLRRTSLSTPNRDELRRPFHRWAAGR